MSADVLNNASEKRRQELQEAKSYRNPTKECDIVMKGGVTSGVVYPLAVCELATIYRLRGIGGTSAGAISAAASAAAEFGRSNPHKPKSTTSGFSGLASIPKTMEEPGNLLRLFRPNKETRLLFNLLLAVQRRREGILIGLQRMLAVVSRLLTAAVRSRWWWLIVLAAVPGTVLATALDWPPTGYWWIGLGLALLLAVLVSVGLSLIHSLRRAEASSVWVSLGSLIAVAAVGSGIVFLTTWADSELMVWSLAVSWVVFTIGILGGALLAVSFTARRVIPANCYGLVTGSIGASAAREVGPLSDWLTGQINKLAGKGYDDDPLTFGELWKGPEGLKKDPNEDPKEPFVNLQMLTTCITLGKSYRLPCDLDLMPRDPKRSFFFKPSEFKKLFPKTVVEFMEEHPPKVPKGSEDKWDLLVEGFNRHELKPLPNAENLPVAVATRMSLSFPFLLSAVPLYAVDWSKRDREWDDETTQTNWQPEKCWFSDGGITSNFPVHFFDRLLPRRPTFGINLRPFHPDSPRDEDQCKNIFGGFIGTRSVVSGD
jgi:hypothetical protein